MAKFDAGTAVDPLEYDFTKYVAGAAGTTPEPSQDQVKEFQHAQMETAKRVKELLGLDLDVSDLEGAQATLTRVDMSKLDPQALDQMSEDLKTKLAKLCSDEPSKEVLDAVPFRVLQAYMGWLSGQLNPKAQGTTT